MKKLFIFITIFILLTGAVVIYLNNIILPTKIKSIFINSLQEYTHKNVSLDSVKFNVFKGLVLRNLVIYDKEGTIASLKEGSCTFLIWPIFKKTIIIPSVRLRNAEIFIERRKDNSFNLQDIFPTNSTHSKPADFNVLVSRVSIIEAIVHFKDNTLEKPFINDLEHVNLSMRLSLPARVKFRLKSQISGQPAAKITAAGEFKIPEQKLMAKISVQDLSLSILSSYYKNSGINISNGQVDALIDLRMQGGEIIADVNAKGNGLELVKDKSIIHLNSNIQSRLQYNLKDKKISYSGESKTLDFNVLSPAVDIKGKGNLSLAVNSWDPAAGPLDLTGNLDIIDTTLKAQKVNVSVENINGRLEFNQEMFKWWDFNFKYIDTLYKTEGVLTNFLSPKIQLKLASRDWHLESALVINKESVDITKLSGKYLNSEFSLKGSVDIGHAPDLQSDLNAEFSVNLQDVLEPLKKFSKQLEQAKLKGVVNVKASLKGNVNDLKTCLIEATFSSANISAFGLQGQDFSLNFNQAEGLANIRSMHLSLYDGSIDGKANINLNVLAMPFWIEAGIEGLKLEKLKLDTPAKAKDLAGTLQAHAKLNGFGNDMSKLNGSGDILIVDGKLWQLNLFQGLGSLLFSKDFANIVFSEGSCSFIVKDKYVISNNLKLNSNITNLSGSIRIGFDSSLDSSINVEVLDEMAPLSGTFKDITTAIIGQSGRFGVIKIGGTLQNPKYKFQAAMVDILKGLKNAIFGQ